uniref:Uncharacterized protein n=1 Tax=Bradyrhizobium japonicum TaxID=375 RepID=M1UZ33_BRAJP|nr:hypothetical protein [Bradyrhizobium japonicum]
MPDCESMRLGTDQLHQHRQIVPGEQLEDGACMPNAAREQRSPPRIMPQESIFAPVAAAHLPLAAQKQFGEPWL